ncbi:hypothetical protein [Pseudomonas protegens]|uniref:hypothetical protein n=1 Tax=Pseudomonas protegens TaxID=380021 RepID=UPI000AF0FC08|nr:hypothetical protein [Pseudomonas protegens]
MSMKQIVCAALVCFGVSMQVLAQPDMKPRIYDSYEFQGLVLPGTALDAKKTGFKNCEFSVYAGYICKRETPGEIYGVRLKSAEVKLNDEANFSGESTTTDKSKLSGVPIEKLSYGSISLKFDSKEEKEFQEKLKLDGWVELSRRYYTYYKRGVNVEIVITRWEATLHPVTTKEVNEILDRLEKEDQERTKKDDAVKKAQDFMKS